MGTVTADTGRTLIRRGKKSGGLTFAGGMSSPPLRRGRALSLRDRDRSLSPEDDRWVGWFPARGGITASP